jgi:hypothetical protein
MQGNFGGARRSFPQSVGMDWKQWEADMAAQRGFVAQWQMGSASAGRALRRVATARGWARPFRGVAGRPLTNDERAALAAALLWVQPPVAFTGWSAAFQYRLIRRLPTKAELLVAHSRRNRHVSSAVVRRTRHFDAARVEVIDGLATVSGSWLLSDLAGQTTGATLRRFLIDLCQRGFADPEAVLELLDLRGPIAGAGKLRTVAEQLREEHSDSVLEYLIRRKIAADRDLPPPAPTPVAVRAADGRECHIDIGWEPRFVGLECLGRIAHQRWHQTEIDVRRSNALVGTPWRILQATWIHVDEEQAWAVLHGHLRRLLRP